MTNTLHRFGSADSFRDDFVVFAIASRGKNEQGALEKLKEFLRLALQLAGQSRRCPAWRSAPSLQEHDSFVSLGSGHQADFRPSSRVRSHHDCRGSVRRQSEGGRLLKAVKERDFGLSINMSTSD